MIYELINPSDAITFKADDDRVAFICALFVGSGKTPATREDGKDIPAMTFLLPGAEQIPFVEQYLGGPLDAFLDAQSSAIAECLQSFAYGKIPARRDYDDALAAISDDEARKAYKARHEDRHRTSMSRIVKHAWEMGKAIASKGKA